MGNALPVSSLIDVTVNLTPAAAQGQNLSNLLVLGNSDVIDVNERMRTYATLTEVATDFGTTVPEYLAAILWFEQSPQPNQLMIGRWAQTATKGLLVGATLSAAEQLMSLWTAVTSGGFHVTVDGGAAQSITGLNFSAQTNLNGVASVIQAALTGATCVWDATYARFQIESASTGATSSISFLTAPVSGTDISGMLGMQSTTSGAYVVDGIAAESALAAATLFDSNFGQQWYGLTMPTIAQDTDHVAVAGYIQGANTKHVYGVSTQEAACLVSTDTTNIGYQLEQLKYSRSVVQYSSSNAYAAVSYLARILTTNYGGNNTVIDMMYKQEPGIVAESLNSTQMAALLKFNVNVFVNYDNNTAIVQPGNMSNGTPTDVITGTDWLAVDIMTSVYNLLYTSTTKIPQTDQGTHLICTTIESVCSQAVINGLLAPGTWNAGGFGALNEGDYLAKGFYVYAPSVNTQSQADRVARKSVPIQVAAKLAGAVRDVNVLVNVNQ